MTVEGVTHTGPIGIYGGSYDPVHLGHLRTALEVRELLDLTEVRFIPSRHPPHRDEPVAGEDLRLAMLEAATAGMTGFVVDARELERPGPSYTIDTLAELQAELPGHPLVLILGMDAFLRLLDWHRAPELEQYASFLVAHRPGWTPPVNGELGDWLDQRQTTQPRELTAEKGRVLLHPVTAMDISSSGIRALVAAGRDPRFLIPESVRRILQQNHCYTDLPEQPGTQTA